MGESQRIEITPRTWVEVRVLKESLGWNGRSLPRGEVVVAEYYQMVPAVKIGQVELVAVLPDYDPEEQPEELLVAPEPPAGE